MLVQKKFPGVLILLVYYNRPLLVRNALNSVKNSRNFDDWHLAVLDDGSDVRAEPIVKEILPDHQDRISYYYNEISFEEKMTRGVTVGGLANRAIAEHDQEIVITLCDDDELHPDYLYKISRLLGYRKEIKYCYSNIYLYNPLTQLSSDATELKGPYNVWKEDIECHGKVDGSQVAFRSAAMKEDGVWWEPETRNISEPDKPFEGNLDAELFKRFLKLYGKAPYTGFVSQYKGVHEHQMVFLKGNALKKENFTSYYEKMLKMAGEIF